MGTIPLNWFDIFVVAFLVFGAFRGRKRGMSQELIPLLKWITLVLVCGFFYAPIAGEIGQGSLFSPLTAAFTAYLGLALIVSLTYTFISRQLGGKVVGSDFFGGAEYYLGIVSGMIRFTCILIFSLALLNGPQYTRQEVNAMARFQRENFEDISFPTFYTVQQAVMRDSFSGPVLEKNLGSVLIKPASTESKGLRRKQAEDLPM
jgi:uncharacterized membrane protein required for colicin V production